MLIFCKKYADISKIKGILLKGICIRTYVPNVKFGA